jgi:hypothetical protein
MSWTERLFAGTALTIQALLAAYFALRAWSFEAAFQIGWVIYAAAIPALVVSLVLARARAPWYLWIGGPLYAAWATSHPTADANPRSGARWLVMIVSQAVQPGPTLRSELDGPVDRVEAG